MVTDFAFELSSFIAVVVIDIYARGVAERADRDRWNFGRVGALFNRAKRFTVVSLILRQTV